MNYLSNTDFEQEGATQTPANWGTWPGSNGTDADADFVEASGYNSSYRLTHYKNTAYEVYTDQVVDNLVNGNYTIRVWTVAGGDHNILYLDAKNYGGTAKTVNIPENGWPNWTYVEITGIQVTNGSITVGLYSDGNANDWCSIDKIELILEH